MENFDLMKSVHQEFEIPIGYAKDLDYMKPYNILSNVLSIQAKDAKNKGNKERVKQLQKTYTLVCKQAFNQLLKLPNNEEVTLLSIVV